MPLGSGRTPESPHSSRASRANGHCSYYGQFSKFHVCFCGLDPGNLKFETVRTNTQYLPLGFETLNLKFCDLKLWKLTVLKSCVFTGARVHLYREQPGKAMTIEPPSVNETPLASFRILCKACSLSLRKITRPNGTTISGSLLDLVKCCFQHHILHHAQDVSLLRLPGNCQAIASNVSGWLCYLPGEISIWLCYLPGCVIYQAIEQTQTVFMLL